MKDAVYIEKAMNSHLLVNLVQPVERVKYIICSFAPASLHQ